MKVIRGKSYEDADGNWNKIEIELTEADLSPEELKAAETAQPVLLELRAETYLVSFLVNNKAMSPEKGRDLMEYFGRIREGFIGTPTLRSK